MTPHTTTPSPLSPGDEPVFSHPWQAQAFAMTLQLHQQGVFSWAEWASALSAEIHGAPAVEPAPGLFVVADDPSPYYTHWLNALEKLIIAKHLGTPDQIHALEHAWEAAAARTPHGEAIVLQSRDRA